MVKVAASIMCGNPLKVGEELKRLEKAKVDMLHIDVMDGKFVSNLAMGFYVIEAIKNATNIPLDVHLAIDDPDRFLDELARIGVDLAAIQVESTTNPHRTVQRIKELGMKVGVVLNPTTPISAIKYFLDEIDMVNIMTVSPGFAGQKIIPETINKIRELKDLITERNLDILIEVDGNINLNTLPMLIPAGANVLVAGTSSIFQSDDVDYKQKVEELKVASERYAQN